MGKLGRIVGRFLPTPEDLGLNIYGQHLDVNRKQQDGTLMVLYYWSHNLSITLTAIKLDKIKQVATVNAAKI